VSLLSVLIPCFNEAATLEAITARVIDTPLDLPKELIIVDDGSTDGSAEIARRLRTKYDGSRAVSIVTEFHSTNRGKGAAVRTALAKATGDMLIIQDADLEYDPRDYPAIIQPMLRGEASVVYGRRTPDARFAKPHPAHWRFAAGNWLVTRVTNLLYGTRLSDQSTGYKAFTREVADRLHLTSDGFEICAEITARVRALGYSIHEVPVTYRPRTVREGKKIRAVDGWRVIRTLIAYRWPRSARRARR
jgi:glycosyltransferase involved in cell wall biosynthesis